MSSYNEVWERNSANAPKFEGISSQTVAFSHYNNLSAQLPINPETGKLVDGGVSEQAEQCFNNIMEITKSIDHVMNDIVRVSIFVTNIKYVEIVNGVYKSFFKSYLPSITVVAVDALPMNALVQVEALLSHGEGSIPNAPQSGDLIKLINNTVNAPISSLSTQTVAFSHYNNLSAQLPIDPKSGRIVAVDIKGQTRQCLKNIKAILESIDVSFDNIVKTNIFIKDINDIDAVNEVYGTFFPDSAIARAVDYLPARTIVVASDLLMGALVQIEVVVAHGDGTPPQKIEDRHGIVIKAKNTKEAPISALSKQTVAFSHYNHIAGQLPIDPKTDEIVAGGVAEQAKQCLKNIKAIIESVNHKLEDVVKVNIFVKNIENLAVIDEVYKKFFIGGIPARRVVGVSAIEGDALVQIDAVVSNAEGTPPML